MAGTIGYIGLGSMGLPMARRLVDAGHALVVHDLDPAAVETLRAAGATVGARVTEVVAAAELLITCLPSPAAVEAVYAEVDRAGLLALDCSTVGPTLAITLHQDLAARGVRYVEGPMLGNVAAAASGDLFLVLSGDAAAVEELAPVLAVISRGHRHVGGPGSASRMKVVQNGLGHIQMVGIAEALTVLAKAGVDLEAWCEVVMAGQGMAATPLFAAKAPDMIGREPAVLGLLRIAAKDIGLTCALADELGVDAPLFHGAAAAYQEALAMGLGEADSAEMARAVERRAGVSLLKG